MGVALLSIGLISFVIATCTYARWLEKKWGIDPSIVTPAHRLQDGVDYVPTSVAVLFGHHFASIAGAAPVVGAITASMWGWLPVFLWIMIACIFIGGVQDFGALFASVRHGGRSIGEVIKAYVGVGGKKLFAAFAWFTTVLLMAAFLDIVAGTFISTPEAATASVLFILLAIVFGIATVRFGLSLPIASVLGVILVFISIWAGVSYPLNISHTAWVMILLVYVYIASIAPVWILLQPRDYLNSFLLYAMMIGSVIGIFIYRPSFELPVATTFVAGGRPLFPILFVTLACGAVSGFHSLVGSGTTSKQLNNEKDARIVGYGGMLLEGSLALIALVTVAYLKPDILVEFRKLGPIYIFSHGVGTFISALGIDFALAQTFGALALSAFAMTTLDTAARLARYIFQEYMAGGEEVDVAEKRGDIFVNRYVSTACGCVLAGILAFYGYLRIWPIFGSANQLLASLTLITLILWMKSMGRTYTMFIYPMIFMAVVTLSALLFIIYTNFPANIPLVVIAIILFILAIVLFKKASSAFKGDNKVSNL